MKQSSYKKYQRVERTLTVEETFARGMQYTGVPLAEGYCRTLVNYDFKDQGRILVPRGGYRTIPQATRVVSQDTRRMQPMHSESIIDLLDDSIHRYVICAPSNTVDTYSFADANILVEDNFIDGIPNMVCAIKDNPDDKYIKIRQNQFPVLLHNMQTDRRYSRDIRASLNNATYVPMLNNNSGCLGRISISRESAEDPYIAKLEPVVPYAPTPTEAINYGYNMLLEDPYSFADRISAALASGVIRCTGLLPYTDSTCQILKFNAAVGAYVTFRLVCEWPNTADEFKFKWEVRDLDSDAVTEYETPSNTSISYHFNGTNAVSSAGAAHVTLTIQPPYKRMAIVVTAYSASDITEPVQVLVLPSYYLTSDSAGSTSAIEVKEYDLSTATGMCTWGQRIVLWGVQGAKNILFVSSVNDPSYFPYPNNCDIVKGQIIHCVEHMGNLLVFTDSQLLKESWAEDGLSYTHSVIQDKLLLSDFDANTVQAVGNMLYFKNSNYYYMIVPTVNISNPTGALTLAPISTPAVINFLDNFEQAVMEIVETMYNPLSTNELQPNESYRLQLSTYHNYTDTSFIRNVYKMRLVSHDSETNGTREIVTFDFILSYDTMLRTWSCYIVEGNNTLLEPYIKSSTNNTMFLNLSNVASIIPVDMPDGSVTYASGYIQMLELVKMDTKNCEDSFTLDHGLASNGRRFKNWQLLDTGYRDHSTHMKKRYREIQFKINNTSRRTLEFGTEFILDDDVRKELFKYEAHVSSTDPNDADFGEIVLERIYDNPILVPGTTNLAGSVQEIMHPIAILHSGDVLQSSRWALGVSVLSPGIQHKIRFPVSGKGYSPRLLLLSFNEQPYELLTYNWVAREMNGR